MLQKLKIKLTTRGGIFIILSLIIEKLSSFVLMILAARFMSVTTYGDFSYVRSLASAFLPFAGFGGNHAFLRFGVKKSLEEKYTMLFSTIVYGLLFSLLFVIFAKPMLISAGFLHSDSTIEMFQIYIFSTLSYYIFDVLRNFHRINDNNKRYSKYGMLYSLLTLLLGTFTLLFFNVTVFIITIVLVPLLTVIIDNRLNLLQKFKKIEFKISFWKYGIIVGAGAFLNQFFLQADILILGYLNMDAELIAKYKVATLLVYTALFVPNAFIVRDFTTIVKYSEDKQYLQKYLWSYYKYASLSLLIFVPTFILLSPYLLVLLFGEKYEFSLQLQNILIFAFVGATLLRLPLGNILNAVGKAQWNVLNASLTLPTTVALLIVLTHKYGVVGSAYAMVIMFFVSGLFSLALFLYYINTLQKGKNE